MRTHRKLIFFAAIVSSFFGFSPPSFAASGEMGTGKVDYASYSQATGFVYTAVWIREPTRPQAAGCAYLIMSPSTMGLDSYKIAVSMVMLAKATGASIRFFAHASRDGGCGVDYLEML